MIRHEQQRPHAPTRPDPCNNKTHKGSRPPDNPKVGIASLERGFPFQSFARAAVPRDPRAAQPRGCGSGSAARGAPGSPRAPQSLGVSRATRGTRQLRGVRLAPPEPPVPPGGLQSHPWDGAATVTLGGPGCWWALVTWRGSGKRARKEIPERKYLPYRSADSSESAADACMHKAFPKITQGSPLSTKNSRGALVCPEPPLRAAGFPSVRIPSPPSARGSPKAPPSPEPFPCCSARGEEQLGGWQHNTLHKFSPSLLQTLSP